MKGYAVLAVRSIDYLKVKKSERRPVMNSNAFGKEWSDLAAAIDELHAKHVGEEVRRHERLRRDDRLLRTLYENMEELVNSIRTVTRP